MHNMKLIMENWNKFKISSSSDLLFEGKDNEISFELLVENYKNNDISENDFSALWVESIDYEMQQLINEGVLDVLQKVGFAVYEKGRKLSQSAIETYHKALQSFNELVIKQFLRITDLLNGIIASGARVVNPVLSVLKKIVGWTRKFCGSHKLLCKAVLGVVVVFLTTLAMGFFASEAEASIKIGSKTFEGHDNSALNAIKGLCQVAGETSADSEIKSAAEECISLINHHAESKEVLDVTKSIDGAEDLISKVWSTVASAVDVANQENDDMLVQIIGDLAEHGKEQTLKVTTKVTEWQTENPFGYSSGTRTATTSTGDVTPMAGKFKYARGAAELAKIATGR